ncbi:MAG: hypothetical protein ABIJ65_05000 [Chloroflexota bacterium]
MASVKQTDIIKKNTWEYQLMDFGLGIPGYFAEQPARHPPLLLISIEVADIPEALWRIV